MMIIAMQLARSAIDETLVDRKRTEAEEFLKQLDQFGLAGNSRSKKTHHR